jgi:hypothetical protein
LRSNLTVLDKSMNLNLAARSIASSDQPLIQSTVQCFEISSND